METETLLGVLALIAASGLLVLGDALGAWGRKSE